MRVTGEEIYAPFSKRTENYDRVKRSWGRSHIPIISLEIMAFFDCDYVIFKHGRPKIASAQYILGSGYADI